MAALEGTGDGPSLAALSGSTPPKPPYRHRNREL